MSPGKQLCMNDVKLCFPPQLPKFHHNYRNYYLKICKKNQSVYIDVFISVLIYIKIYRYTKISVFESK